MVELAGFSPQKSKLTVYIMRGLEEYGNLLEKLGKHKIGKSCLCINKLADIDKDVLKEIIMKSLEALN